MCIAGALRASLEVWRPKYEVFQIYSPCVCQVMEGIGRVVHTVGQIQENRFVLMETKKDKRPTRYPKPEPHLQLASKLIHCMPFCFSQISVFTNKYLFPSTFIGGHGMGKARGI